MLAGFFTFARSIDHGLRYKNYVSNIVEALEEAPQALKDAKICTYWIVNRLVDDIFENIGCSEETAPRKFFDRPNGGGKIEYKPYIKKGFYAVMKIVIFARNIFAPELETLGIKACEVGSRGLRAFHWTVKKAYQTYSNPR